GCGLLRPPRPDPPAMRGGRGGRRAAAGDRAPAGGPAGGRPSGSPMSELLRDRIRVAVPPSALWAIVADADALGRVLPGLETIEARAPGAFAATLAAKIQFLTVRADVEATLARTSPSQARLRLSGRPRGLVGTFTAEIPFEIRAVPDPVRADPVSADPASEVEYAV